MSIVFLNHKFISEDEAKIPVSDRGFLFGDGVYTTLKVAHGKIEFWREHLARLYVQAAMLGIASPDIAPGDLQELVRRNSAMAGVFRLKIILTGGDSHELGLSKRNFGQYLMTIQPVQNLVNTSRLALFPFPLQSLLSKYKSLAYLERLWMKEYAKTQGVEDVLAFDMEGNILETAFSNFFWRINNELFFPDPGLAVLNGVILEIVKEIAEKKLDMVLRPAKIKFEKLPKNAQLFCCNSIRGIYPIDYCGDQIFKKDLSWENYLFGEFEEQTISKSLHLN